MWTSKCSGRRSTGTGGNKRRCPNLFVSSQASYVIQRVVRICEIVVSNLYLLSEEPFKLVASPLPTQQRQLHSALSLSRVNNVHFYVKKLVYACSALTLLIGWQEGHPACKNWVMRCWRGYLSGARCKWFACGPADATVTSSSLAPVTSRMI